MHRIRNQTYSYLLLRSIKSMLCRSLREAAAISLAEKFFAANKSKMDEALLVAITVFDSTSYERKPSLLAERDYITCMMVLECQ